MDSQTQAALLQTNRNHDDLVGRGVAAWFRATKGYPLYQQPSMALSTVEDVDGLLYVQLRNERGLQASYRVKKDGALRRLRRLPRNLKERELELTAALVQEETQP